MTGQAAFEFVSEFRFTCNKLLVTGLTVYVGSFLERLNLRIHTGSLEVAALTLGHFLSLCVSNLLTVFTTVMALSTFCYFLMLLVRKYSRLRFFCFVFLSLQRHLGRTVVCDDDTGTKEKNSPKYANNDFFGHGVRSF